MEGSVGGRRARPLGRRAGRLIRSSARWRSPPSAIQPRGRRSSRRCRSAGATRGCCAARRARRRALEATATCPACGEPVEFAAEVASLLDRDREAASVAPVETDGFVVSWRPPDSDDVAAAAAAGDAAAAERVLLARCVAHRDRARRARSRARRCLPRCARPWPRRWPTPTRSPRCWSTSPAPPAGPPSSPTSTSSASSGRSCAPTRSACCARSTSLARAYGWTEAEVLALGERGGPRT